MKLRVVTPWFPTSADPVDGSFVAAQTAALRQFGHDVTCCVVRPCAPWVAGLLSRKWAFFAATPKAWTWNGVEAHRHRYLAVPRYALYGGEGRRMAKTLASHVEPHRTDAILAHTELAGEAVLRARQGRKPPVVVIVHGINLASGMLATRRRRDNLRWTLQQADRVVVVGVRLIDTVVSWGAPPEKVRVVHNGFDPGLVEATAGHCSANLGNRLEVLSVSNLVSGKGVDVNLRALASLVREGASVRYTIVGDGRSRGDLERLARKLGVQEHVRFLGRLEPAAVHRELAACDIFSLPSSPEAFGIVYAEAMAHGKPIVGCAGEGPSSFCRDGEEGFLVPSGDHAAVAAAWRRLLDAGPRTTIGNAGRARAFAELTWSRSAAQLVSVLHEVVSAT